MTERQPAFFTQALHLVEGLADVLAEQHDFGSIGATGIHLALHGTERHDYRDMDAQFAARPGKPLTRQRGFGDRYFPFFGSLPAS